MVLATTKQNKLEVNWIGPGKVLSRISDTNYVIDLPGRRDRSIVYHVNLLKPYHRRSELVSLVVEEVSDDIEGDAEIPYPDPGTTHLMRMDIELISDKPIKIKPYRMSPRQINILREEIKRLLELCAIEIGQSDYTSPLILVESPNRDPRPCVDYRRLNEITRAEFFPLPKMEEIVEKVSVAPYVTVMDLSKGYFQIPLTPRVQRYAASVTPFGTYIPKKMIFGIVCAPYYFCKLMAQGLEGLEQFALPYIDKIAIFSQGWKDHVKHIDIVLGRFRKAGLKVKPCKLGYYSHYIPNYSTIASPLTDALTGKIKKEKITWDEKCEKAFEELKKPNSSPNPYCLPRFCHGFHPANGREIREVLDRYADDESWTRIRENALRTVPRQAVERATSKEATILARHRDYQLHNLL
ncbi:hypothetical protein TNCV_3357661 [Trichonephila clavipes]|nr:hypothetical protein TNCV_3357661 [Trichonephila clavipes]